MEKEVKLLPPKDESTMASMTKAATALQTLKLEFLRTTGLMDVAIRALIEVNKFMIEWRGRKDAEHTKSRDKAGGGL